MPLEVASTIAELDDSYPLGGDPTNRGDDHLRLIKAVLKTQFPGSLGQGYDIPILTNETELNYLQGATSNIQNQIDALQLSVETTLHAPSGTVMPFFQASAPTGWTQVVTHNDVMLRVVNTAGGGNGGTDSPILMNKVPSHTHTTVSAGAHTHFSNDILYRYGGLGATDGGSTISFSNVETTSNGAHTHTINANAGAANWTPKYINMIIASKD